jgi:hypothetical protein
MGTVAESYYTARSRRDPAWRQAAIRAAAERYRRAKEADPERVREWSREYRERLRRRSLTITQLAERATVDHGNAGPDVLRAVLRDEIRRGRVELVQGRYYRLNGALPDDVKTALRELEL